MYMRSRKTFLQARPCSKGGTDSARGGHIVTAAQAAEVDLLGSTARYAARN